MQLTEGECTCCKEIYYLALKKIPHIGIATIYRMVNSLEDIGAIQRKSVYQVCARAKAKVETCYIKLDSENFVELEGDSLLRVLERGMEACGYLKGERIESIQVDNRI